MTQERFSVRRREDGSIDTDFYSVRARVLRKAESRALMAGVWRSLTKMRDISLRPSVRRKHILRHAPY